MANVLVVDDSPTQLRRTSLLLSDAGYSVTTATDGEEALELANHHVLDAVVLDIILPKKNGYQVCRQLKANPAHKGLKILLLTSKTHEQDREWGEKQGADAYITKPFDEAALLETIQSMLCDATGHAQEDHDGITEPR